MAGHQLGAIMTLDPRTPVIVGAAAVSQHVDDPIEATEPLELMAEALECAADDAGSRTLRSAVDCIWAPRGFWAYSNPGRLLAERFDASSVRTAIAEIGVLQTTVLGRAAAAIAEGRSEISMIVGGEARDRASRLRRKGLDVPLTIQTEDGPGNIPDEVLRPADEIMGRFEIELGLITPTIQYAMIDNALRAHEGQSLDEHRAELASLWGGFNRVAVENPDAWDREPKSGAEICSPTETNRMLAYPYTKSLVSQWNVNQAGGLILCSYEKAKALGLDESRFIYPLAVVDSEHMVTLSERHDLHRSPGFRFAGRRALRHVDRAVSEIEHLELYSCFPAAVRVQQREMGIDRSRCATQTGGMTFAGGPLNNFVVQGWVKMVETLRADPGSSGLVSAVSGLLTKQGVSLLGPEPSRPFLHDNVTAEVAADHVNTEVVPEATGRARVSTYTVATERNAAQGVVLVCDFDETRRTLRVVDDPELAKAATREEIIGREVELGPENALRWL
jgi:acetyl-CoA C-acetyltransferase